MAGTSSEGVGQGSVEDIYPKIVNNVVKTENLQQVVTGSTEIFIGVTSDILISTADGTAGNDDASSITIKAGDGYPLAVDPVESDGDGGDNADGGDVNIYAGAANGEGEGGDINIQAGNTGDGPDANAGNVTIRGGNADNAENSDAGDVNIYGGDASSGIGDSDGGDINIQAGDAAESGEAGSVYIRGGNSGTGDGDGSTGDIEIYAGNSNATTDLEGGDISIYSGNGTVNGRGGDLSLYTGTSVGTDRAGDMFFSCGTNSGAGRNGHIYIQSMPVMPVYADNTARDAAAGTPTNGMFCYNTATNNVEFYINGAWNTFNLST